MKRPLWIGLGAVVLLLGVFYLYRTYRRAYLSGAVEEFQEVVREQEDMLRDLELREGNPPEDPTLSVPKGANTGI
ncbi:MAG: hypothetical protein KDD51_06840 [Bdellovibrionales bacterium]|nr:hypothetical protein [Bdellovibrionales bacterium]